VPGCKLAASMQTRRMAIADGLPSPTERASVSAISLKVKGKVVYLI